MVGVGALAVKTLFNFAGEVGTAVAPEVIETVSDFLKKKLKNLSERLSEPAQEVIKQAGNLSKDESGNMEISTEVLDELRRMVGETLQEQISSVYAYCVTFFIDGVLDDNEQELVQDIIEGNLDSWDIEIPEEKQEFIDEFRSRYFGGTVHEGEEYEISDKYINLNFSDDEDRVRCEEDMRDMADILNYFLRGRYITRFNLE